MSDLLRLQDFLRETAATGRTVLPLPPFTAYLHPSDPLRFFNYAIPEDSEPDAAEIELLQETFRAHDRLPRLEWIEEAAPHVAPALAAGGMVEELRTPLMQCEPGDLLEALAAVDDLVVATVGDDDLRETANLQRVAFGQDELEEDEAPRDPRAKGGGAVLARASHKPVAAASWTPIVDGVSEIVGVATAEPWRGRGLAGAVTAAAASAAYEAGALLCILSPGDEVAQRVYARAGFRRAATILHWSDPNS